MKCDSEKKKVSVSIITPCLNSEDTIQDTIESVLNQTYAPAEYIIVDGGSGDGTLQIIKEYEPLFHGRLRYVSEKDTGIYNAMNKGIRMSRGSLIGIINSDDYYETDAVERAVLHMGKEICQVIYGYLRIIERTGTIKYARVEHDSLPKKMIGHPTCFVTRETYRQCGLFLESLRVTADYELMLRLYRNNKVEFHLIPSVMANFRAGGASYDVRTSMEHELSRLIHGYGSVKEFWGACRDFMLKNDMGQERHIDE